MKKLLYSALIIALLATACSKDGIIVNPNSEGGELKQCSFTAVMAEEDNDSATRAADKNGWSSIPFSEIVDTRISTDITNGATTWSLGDQVLLTLSISDATSSVFTATEISIDKKTATLTGKLATVGNDQCIAYGIHPSTGTYNSAWHQPESIEFQDNTLNKIAMVAHPTKVDPTKPTIDEHISFSHIYAGLGVKLQLPANTKSTVKSILVSVANDDGNYAIATSFARSVDITLYSVESNFAKLFTYDANEQSIPIKITPSSPIKINDEGVFEVYAKIYPVDLRYEKLNFTVTMSDGTTYVGEKGAIDFIRGKFYRHSDTSTPIQLKAITNIVFEDVNLKNHLLSTYSQDLAEGVTNLDMNGDGEISTDEALNLIVFRKSWDYNFTSLKGLEHFTELTEFVFDRAISSGESLDLSVISKLTKLKDINLTGNYLPSLPDLSNLTQLTRLDCSSNKLTLLPDLSKFTELTTLYCYANQLTTLPDMSKLTKLVTLDILDNRDLTISDFSNFTNLTYLAYSGSGLDNIANTIYLSKLEFLDFSRSNITDISAIATLTNLTRINGSGNKSISNLPLIKSITKLTHFDFSDCSISDLSFISELANLIQIDVSGNIITDMSVISGLSLLEELYCFRNKMSTLDISKNSNMSRLYCKEQTNDNVNSLELTLTQAQKTKTEESKNNWRLNEPTKFVIVP